MIRRIVYRFYSSRKQLDKLYSAFRLCSELYDLLLDEHKAVYEQTGASLTRNDMNNLITNIKQHDARFKSVYGQVLQNQSDRLSRAFNNFLKVVARKSKERASRSGTLVIKRQFTR